MNGEDFWKEMSELMKGTPISQAVTESRKNQALIRECIEYCRPPKTDFFYIREIHDCEKLKEPSVASLMGMKCRSEFKASIDIRMSVKNRFGEEYIESSTCDWRGNEYTLTAICGKSSAKFQEDTAPRSTRQVIQVPILIPKYLDNEK